MEPTLIALSTTVIRVWEGVHDLRVKECACVFPKALVAANFDSSSGQARVFDEFLEFDSAVFHLDHLRHRRRFDDLILRPVLLLFESKENLAEVLVIIGDERLVLLGA